VSIYTQAAPKKPRAPREAPRACEPEALVQRRILLAIGSLPGVLVYRNSVGVAEYQDHDGKRRTVKYGLDTGTPDLVVLLTVSVEVRGAVRRICMWVGLEVKAEDGEPSEDQLRVQRQWHAMGAHYSFVRSIPEALAALDRARRGELS
jgi:hypothetical protein